MYSVNSYSYTMYCMYLQSHGEQHVMHVVDVNLLRRFRN